MVWRVGCGGGGGVAGGGGMTGAGAVPTPLALGPPGLAMAGGDAGGHGGAPWTESWPRQVMERQVRDTLRDVTRGGT